jgi:hypothetical protein
MTAPDLVARDRLLTDIGTEFKRCTLLLTKYATALTSPTASYKFSRLQQIMTASTAAIASCDVTDLQTCLTHLRTFK